MITMFKGKAGSLNYLKGLGLNVPEWQVINHLEILSWGDQTLWNDFTIALLSNKKIDHIIPLELFLKSVIIPKHRLNPFSGNTYAIRSSASVEDSPENSFAGIFATKLFISDQYAKSIIEVWSSLYSSASLQYCEARLINLNDLSMDVIVQKMITGEKSGILFQADPTGVMGIQMIVAGWGQGQGIVEDVSDSDKYVIAGTNIIQSIITNKLIYLDHDLKKTKVPSEKSLISTLSEKDIDKLLAASEKISTNNKNMMDLEFTFVDKDLFVLQVRPITTMNQLTQAILGSSPDQVFGIPCSGGKAEAECVVVRDLNQASDLNGKILVAHSMDPEWGYLFTGLKGIIIEKGSLLSHAAIISRELGIPCIINAANATTLIKTGMKVSMDGDNGEIKLVQPEGHTKKD
ncbi:MAG TPA: PEP/pyruvate-binding domain-containing protein [Bacteriovoracaceae bacterium]|nr:PEP/pyruvate-binding domain-containing protein [Bacteriovoracaceae bacterium]